MYAELLTSEDLDNIPDLEPLIKDMLNLDTITWMFGQSGSCKSFVALDMAGCIGSGEPWQGCLTTKGPVLYVVAEGKRGIQRRVRAWEESYKHRMTDVKFMPRAVQIKSLDFGYLTEVAIRMGALFIVLDTQARMTVGVEENSSMEMGVIMARMDEMRIATGACVLAVHHTGWDGEHGRGSTATRGAFDSAIKVERKGDYVTVSSDKEKDMDDFEPIHLRKAKSGKSIVLVEAGVDAHQNTYAEVDAATLDLRRDWWRHCQDREISTTQLDLAKVVSRSTIERHRFDMLDQGFIEETGKGNMTRLRLKFEPHLPTREGTP
jgi:hypothetical protein